MRKLLMTIICFWAVSTMFGQTFSENVADEVYDRYDESDVNNTPWFITLGVGPQVYFGDHNKQMKFGNIISPALDVAIGKWLSDKIGVRLVYSGLSVKGAAQNDSYTNGKKIKDKPWDGYWLKEQKFNFFNIHGDLLLNFSRFFSKEEEKEQPFYNFVPYVGLGWAHVLEKPTNNALSINAGFLNIFRLTHKIDLNLDIRGAYLNDEFDGEIGERSGEGILSVTVGASYRF